MTVLPAKTETEHDWKNGAETTLHPDLDLREQTMYIIFIGRFVACGASIT
jgi:hypothetical protein